MQNRARHMLRHIDKQHDPFMPESARTPLG
jgi:hypothetical protein